MGDAFEPDYVTAERPQTQRPVQVHPEVSASPWRRKCPDGQTNLRTHRSCNPFELRCIFRFQIRSNVGQRVNDRGLQAVLLRNNDDP